MSMYLTLDKGWVSVDAHDEYSYEVTITNDSDLHDVAVELSGYDDDEAMLLVAELNGVLRSANELGTIMTEIVRVDWMHNALVTAEPEVARHEWSF